MSSNPAEPEKYSLDEMLDRLQGKSAPDPLAAGELVTRADGSQAIKVRKRKRRSVQPHKEAAKRTVRLRAIQVSSAVILTGLLGLSFGGVIIYANSASYRSSLAGKISAGSGAKVELQQLRVSPTSSNANAATLTWPEGSLVKNASLIGVEAKALLGGVLGSQWSVDDLSVNRGILHIGTQTPGAPMRFIPKPAGKSPVQFDRMSVAKLDVLIGDPTQPALSLEETESTFYPNSANPSLRLFRGNAKVPGWPLFRLDRCLLEFKGDQVELVTVRLLHELDNTGDIEISGTLDPAATAKEQKLGVKLSSFNLNGIAGTSLGHLIAGRIDSTDTLGGNHLSFSANTGGKLKVAFRSASNTFPKINSFPFLGKLTKLTDNPWFAEPLFSDGCTGILERDIHSVNIRDFSVLSRNQLWIKGDLTVQSNDVLTGTLDVGIPEASVNGAKNPELKDIFQESRDGFRWIHLKISGSGSRPIDNFDEVRQGVKAGATTSEGDLFDRLTQPKGQ